MNADETLEAKIKKAAEAIRKRKPFTTNETESTEFKIKMNLNWWDHFEVVNCIFCLDNKRAKIFSGHLRVNEGTVGAGFCSEECLNKANLSMYNGYLGWWKPEYGLQYRDLRDEY